jgi:hypothetical protein
MLFKYNFVNHDAEILQKLIEHVVLDVWCNAKGKNFNLNRIKEENNFRKIVRAKPVALKKHIHEIYKICSKLNDSKLTYIKNAFYANNNIQALCINTVNPVFYDDLSSNINSLFAKKIKNFFNNLYENVFNQQPFYINKHYDKFFQSNKAICPFCGLVSLQKNSLVHRESYDHYLPKEKYPFNAVNLKNLLPMCSKCNEFYKKSKDPLFDTSRKKAFFYFGNNPEFNIEINIVNPSVNNFLLDLTFTSSVMQEEVNTWNRLFELDKRYKDDFFYADNNYGVTILNHWYSCSKRDCKYVENEMYFFKQNQYIDKNFLRKSLLQACIDQEIFNDSLDSL